MLLNISDLEAEAKRRLGELGESHTMKKLAEALLLFEESTSNQKGPMSAVTSFASLPSSKKREQEGYDEADIDLLLEQTLQRLTLVPPKMVKNESKIDLPNSVSQPNEGVAVGGGQDMKRYRDRLIAFNSNTRKDDKLYEEALNLYLSLDVPSLRWPIDPEEEDKDLRTTRKDLSQWASDKLSSLHIDVSLDTIMQSMISQLIKSRFSARVTKQEASNQAAKANAAKPEWFRMMPTASLDMIQDSYKFTSIVYLLSSSASLGWSSIKKALSHTLFSSDDEPMGRKRSGPGAKSVTIGSNASGWSPMSFENRFVDLQQSIPGLVDKAMNRLQSYYRKHKSVQPQPQDFEEISKAALEELLLMNRAELVDGAMAFLPMTYLQIVGQKILYHASTELPFISSLPSSECGSAVLSLYARPFTSAVHQAVQAILENPESIDPVPFASRAVEDLGNKRWRGIGSLAGAPHGHAPHASAGGPGGGAEHDGEGGRAGGVKNSTKVVLNMIRGICKDVSSFQQGLFDILDRDPGLFDISSVNPSDLMSPQESSRGPPERSPSALGRSSSSATEPRIKEQLRMQLKATPETHVEMIGGSSFYQLHASSLKSLIRADVKASMNRERNGLFQLIFASLNEAVKSMLAAGSTNAQEEVRGEQIWPEVNPSLFPPTSPSSPSRFGPKTEGFLDDKPQYIDSTSHQILVLLFKYSHGLSLQPDIVQAPLAVAILEGLSLLMDSLAAQAENLSSHNTGSKTKDVSSPKKLLLLHSAALCIRRQLLSFSSALDMPLQDEFYDSMVKGYGHTLMQADDLAMSLSQKVVAAHAHAANSLIWTSVDRAEWASFKKPGKRPQGASAAPRMWRLALIRLMHVLAQTCSLSFTTWILGQVIQEGLGAAAMRYAFLSPSSHLLTRYASDILHITSTCFMFSLTIPVPLLEAMTLATPASAPESVEISGPSKLQVTNRQGSVVSPSAISRSKSQATLDALKNNTRVKSKANLGLGEFKPEISLPSAIIFAGDIPSIILPSPIVAALSSTCCALSTRASLLLCSPHELASKILATSKEEGSSGNLSKPWLGLRLGLGPRPVAEGVEEGEEGEGDVKGEREEAEDRPSPSPQTRDVDNTSNSSRISASLSTSTSATHAHRLSRQLMVSQSARPSRTERPPVSHLSRHLRINEEPEAAAAPGTSGGDQVMVDQVKGKGPLVESSSEQVTRDDAEIEESWGWLPVEIKKDLTAASKRMITAKQLASISGFDPLEHVDLLASGPYIPPPPSSSQPIGASFLASAALAPVLTPEPPLSNPPGAGRGGRALMKSKTAIGGGSAAAATASVAPSAEASTSRAPLYIQVKSDPWSEALAGLWAGSRFPTCIQALSKRHELHVKVQGLPYSLEELDARVYLGRIAEQFGVRSSIE